MPRVRETIGGRYELTEVLGRGGMGVVYRATDRVLERDVAVKLLAAELSEDPTFVARFAREARAAAALGHANVVSVYDSGRDGEDRYIVMEYVRGEDLGQLLRREGPLSPARAAAIGVPIAKALAAAHRKGIVHRDIKPGNVMVDDGGLIKVLDFGIARAIAGATLTQTAVVLGSAPYLAPELARGAPADERSDIYSLGCVLYELLSGRPPFTAELPVAVMHQHSSTPPRPLRALVPAVPESLEALVGSMLAKHPDDRPQRADDVARALTAAGREPAPARTAATRVIANVPEVTSGGHHRLRAAAALVAAAAAVIAVLLLHSSGGTDLPRAAVSGTHVSHRARRPAAPTPPATTPAAHAASATPPATTTTTQNAPPAVPSAAASLARLVAGDVQSGLIDGHASQQLIGGIQDILAGYAGGHSQDVFHRIGDLGHHVTDLAAHGDIQPAALPAISAAINTLGSALARSTPASGGPAADQGHGKGDHKDHGD